MVKLDSHGWEAKGSARSQRSASGIDISSCRLKSQNPAVANLSACAEKSEPVSLVTNATKVACVPSSVPQNVKIPARAYCPEVAVSPLNEKVQTVMVPECKTRESSVRLVLQQICNTEVGRRARACRSLWRVKLGGKSEDKVVCDVIKDECNVDICSLFSSV